MPNGRAAADIPNTKVQLEAVLGAGWLATTSAIWGYAENIYSLRALRLVTQSRPRQDAPGNGWVEHGRRLAGLLCAQWPECPVERGLRERPRTCRGMRCAPAVGTPDRGLSHLQYWTHQRCCRLPARARGTPAEDNALICYCRPQATSSSIFEIHWDPAQYRGAPRPLARAELPASVFSPTQAPVGMAGIIHSTADASGLLL